VDAGIDSISVSPDVALETIVKVAEIEEQKKQEPGYEFSVESMFGTPAGNVYDALNSHGRVTVDKLLDFTSEKVDSHSLNQALGWLAKEGKLEVHNENGKVTYSLK